MRRLGVSVGAQVVRAVLVAEGRISWAGSAAWSDDQELADAIARLAAECGTAVRRARFVLARDLLQLRTIVPAPPLRGAAARRYVALEAPRLFRKNGAALVTDAKLVSVDQNRRALLAAAASENTLRAILAGSQEAGITVDSLGPAAEVMPYAVQGSAIGLELAFPNGGTSEVLSIGTGGAWRSRLVSGIRDTTMQWDPALQTLGAEAVHFAPAFGAALRIPEMQLLPADTRTSRQAFARKRLLWIGVCAVCLWLTAGVVYTARLTLGAAAARRELEATAAVIDTALAERRELDAARRTLAEFSAAERGRSRHLATLARVTKALDDSTFLVALQIGLDAQLRVVGYSPSAARVVVQLERARFDAPRMESPVVRERVPGGLERERFTIVARTRAP